MKSLIEGRVSILASPLGGQGEKRSFSLMSPLRRCDVSCLTRSRLGLLQEEQDVVAGEDACAAFLSLTRPRHGLVYKK